MSSANRNWFLASTIAIQVEALGVTLAICIFGIIAFAQESKCLLLFVQKLC